ncbi:MAG: hypothetical protein ACTHOK_21100 [Nocardioidaceae bacterium]
MSTTTDTTPATPTTPGAHSAVDAAHTAATAAATAATTLREAPEHFRRLLAQRRLWGQLAEYQRSHRGQTTTTDMMDHLVATLSEELEDAYPDLWAAVEPDLLVTEAGLLHDPAAGQLVGCGLCHEATRSTRSTRQQRRTTTRRAATRRRSTACQVSGDVAGQVA